MRRSGLVAALIIGDFIALDRADKRHPQPGRLLPFRVVLLRPELDIVRDRRSTDRQRADRNAGHVAAHRHAAVERELLDHLREQAARQRRRIELGPEVNGVDGLGGELRGVVVFLG